MVFHHVGQAGLELLTSGDLPASASQSAGITVKLGFHHIGQAGLELLTSGDPPTSASQSAGITDPFLLSAPTITYEVECHRLWHRVQPHEVQLENER
ncbi:hypothetical protein AAY473_027379 [Plecturocebus cupreus]